MAAHRTKLPRQQWALFELARLSAEVETAVQFSLKALQDDLENSELIRAAARLHAASAAREVAQTGLRLLRASGAYSEEEIQDWREAAKFEQCMAASAGEMEWMAEIVEALRD